MLPRSPKPRAAVNLSHTESVRCESLQNDEKDEGEGEGEVHDDFAICNVRVYALYRHPRGIMSRTLAINHG